MVEPGPGFAVQDVHNGWLNGFRRLGCDVKSFNLSERLTYHEAAMARLKPDIDRGDKAEGSIALATESLFASCYSYLPDVVVVVSSFFVPAFAYDLLKARGVKVAVLLTESPYEDSTQANIAARADLALVNDPTNLGMFRERQPNTFYIPHAYDPTVHKRRPASPDLVCDFGWVGTAFDSRRAFFEAVDWSGIDVGFAGNWVGYDGKLAPFLVNPPGTCFDNDATVDMYSSCKASANLYRKETGPTDIHDGWAMGPREVELAACGTFFLTEERGENREVLPMVPTFTGPEDFEDQLRWYLAHDTERERVAQAARAAIADRTFDNNCKFLLGKL